MNATFFTGKVFNMFKVLDYVFILPFCNLTMLCTTS